jgi:polysaccharide deacetylase 2 family uncharacterized protein YibQ
MKALAVAAGIVFWTLVLGAVWLSFFSGGAGEPVAVLQIEPADVSASPPAGSSDTGSEASSAAPAIGGVDLPPGFAVTGPETPPQQPAPSLPGTTMIPPTGVQTVPVPPPDAAPPGPQGALSPPGPPGSPGQQAGPETQMAAANAAAKAVPVVEAGIITLGPTPADGLVEETQYGPLPKIAADGRRPAEVYARPSRYAPKAAAGEPARIAVLVNGLGLPDSPDGEILKDLPAPVSVAYGAYARSAQDWVTEARAEGHEVLLQIPLEPENYPTVDPGPHTLLTTLPTEENLKRLQWLMSRYTGYVGVTNHMGAKFEATKDAFLPVLEELKRRGLLYVDDGTAPASAAGEMASVLGLDYSVANVQLDDEPSVAKGLVKLEAAARERGAAIGVAKAKAATIKQLAEWADTLEKRGFVLVPVSAAVRSQRQS